MPFLQPYLNLLPRRVDLHTQEPPGLRWSICDRLLVALLAVINVSVCSAQGTVAIDEAPPALSHGDAVKQFKLADGMEIRLVAGEPKVSQPLSISFDDRGRMWVLQYRQFPNPNGFRRAAG